MSYATTWSGEGLRVKGEGNEGTIDNATRHFERSGEAPCPPRVAMERFIVLETPRPGAAQGEGPGEILVAGLRARLVVGGSRCS